MHNKAFLCSPVYQAMKELENWFTASKVRSKKWTLLLFVDAECWQSKGIVMTLFAMKDFVRGWSIVFVFVRSLFVFNCLPSKGWTPR